MFSPSVFLVFDNISKSSLICKRTCRAPRRQHNFLLNSQLLAFLSAFLIVVKLLRPLAILRMTMIIQIVRIKYELVGSRCQQQEGCKENVEIHLVPFDKLSIGAIYSALDKVCRALLLWKPISLMCYIWKLCT